MSDPTVLYDVTEQVEEAIRSAPVLGMCWTERKLRVISTYAASTALHETADILRERAEVYTEQGKHEAARALLDEADRLADYERARPPIP